MQTIGLPYGEDVRYQRAEPPLTIDTPAAARTFFSSCFGEQAPGSETLWVAHLDEKARCLHLSRHEGNSAGVALPLRTIVLDAALHGTAAILLAHNHPSGDARPSQSDLDATRRLASLAGAMDCRIVDHLVFAGAECTSLKALGYL